MPRLEDAALVLIECQHIWTRPGHWPRIYHALVRRQMAQRDVMGGLQRACASARAAHVPVLHAPLNIDPLHKRGGFARLSGGLLFRAGSQSAQIDARLLAGTDIVVQGRTAFDAFVSSDLYARLQDTGRRTLLLGGFITDQCVARTARTARQLGYDTWLITDACATVSSWQQRWAEQSFGDKCLDSNQVQAHAQA
jgi:nicotinamidase-related amidase